MAKNKFHYGSGPSQRQLRVGELIRRTLSNILTSGKIHDLDLNRISISVGEVRTSPDLRIATAYVSALGGAQNYNLISLLNKNKNELRRAISRNLTLKYSPEIRFRLDETFDRMDETRQLFSNDKVRRDLDGK